MLNDRDERFENNEESEYHFSDDDINYEVEAETPKPVVATEQKENILNRLTRSKRMLISMGVFLVLIFIVYKMVSPGGSATPSTDITPAGVIAQQTAKPQQQPPVMSATPPATAPNVQPAAQVAQTMPAVQPPTVSLPAAPVVSQQQQNMNNAAPAPTQQMLSPAEAMAQSSNNNMNIPAASQMQQVPQQPAGMPATQQQPQQNVPIVNNMMSMIPGGGQPTMPSGNISQPTPPSPAAINPPISGAVDAKMAMVATESNKLISQLQNDYTQKMNDYEAQNKALQDQLQALNTRIAGMENQMNQLIQAVTRQSQHSQQGVSNNPVPAQPQAADQPRIPYNVQAIIPGRAWLRSDNGETVTVAEGDVIKDVGRVTKIDPYDGVVEINTGNRVVSLSYGNGG